MQPSPKGQKRPAASAKAVRVARTGDGRKADDVPASEAELDAGYEALIAEMNCAQKSAAPKA